MDESLKQSTALGGAAERMSKQPLAEEMNPVVGVEVKNETTSQIENIGGLKLEGLVKAEAALGLLKSVRTTSLAFDALNVVTPRSSVLDALPVVTPSSSVLGALSAVTPSPGVLGALSAVTPGPGALGALSTVTPSPGVLGALSVATPNLSARFTDTLSAASFLPSLPASNPFQRAFLQENLAYRPTESAVKLFALETPGDKLPFYLASRDIWANELAAKINSLDVKWAAPGQLRESVSAFANLSLLSKAIQSRPPFGAETSRLMTTALGGIPIDMEGEPPLVRDLAAVDAGLNPELIAFPPGIYDDVIKAAGFNWDGLVPSPPLPIENATNGYSAKFDPTHNTIFVAVEQRLRRFVSQQLKGQVGHGWVKQRVPDMVRQRWSERQNQERSEQRPVFALIEYADFMDLHDIIVKNDNWKELFCHVFKDKDDFSVSLRRLHPIRKALAHSRPLGRADILTLAAETRRIFDALERASY